VENAVLAQARSRAVSVAAEASLQRKHIEELRRQQREKEEAEAQAARDRAPPLFSNDILTPTPVFSQGYSNNTETSQASTDSDSPKSTSGVEVTVEQPPLKALGELSIREFEANLDDPFEIASLQAINDMEVLQSVLQPIPPPILTSANTSTAMTGPSVTNQQLTTAEPSRSHSSPIPTPRSRTAVNTPAIYPGEKCLEEYTMYT